MKRYRTAIDSSYFYTLSFRLLHTARSSRFKIGCMEEENKNQQPCPWASAGTRVTRLGSVIRLDVNNVGANMPSRFSRFRDRDEAPDAEEKEQWISMENEALIAGLSSTAERHGGGFRSFAEWTVTDHWFHMHFGTGEGGIRERRAKAFGPGYRAAISSLNWLNPDCSESGRLQATAFIPVDAASFSQRAWRPSAMADYEAFVVAPAVLTDWDGVRHVHIAGILGVDPDFNVVAKGNPEAQIRHVLETIRSVAREAGGTPSDVIRLRPFVNNAAMACTTQRLIDELWEDETPPAAIIADDMRFSADSPFYIECQAAVLIGAEHKVLHRNGRLVVRESRSGEWRMLEAGEITVGASKDAAENAARQAAETLDGCGWRVEEAVVVFAYAAGPIAYRDTERALESAGFSRESLHIVPSRDMDNDAIRVSIIAARSAGE